MLALTIFIPLIFALAAAFFNAAAARAGAIAASAISLILLLLCARADAADFALTVIASINFGINLTASAASYALAITAAFMVLASSIFLRFGRAEFICSQLLLACMNGLFFADDALLFYIFWEASLLPLLFLMQRSGAGEIAKKFFVFAFFGSIFMLLAIIYLAHGAASNGRTLDFAISAMNLPGGAADSWLFFAFVLAFAIKAPIFPLHSWAIKTYAQAPTFASVMLASFKMAPFGFIKFMPLFSEQFERFGPTLAAICAASAVYCALLALSRSCYKELIATSSISHLGIICAGIFANSELAVTGALFYMIAHALVSGGMFFYAEIFATRFGTLEIARLSHLSRAMPFATLLFGVLLFASISLPFTASFVGEFLVLSQLFAAQAATGVVATLVVIFGSIYMLVFFRRSFLSPGAQSAAGCAAKLCASEIFVLCALALIVLFLGVWPADLLTYLAM